MIVYPGTTDKRARSICLEGFRPRKPSRRVWFAESKGYALRRARTQAKRARDRAVVLTCEINVHQLRGRLGSKRIFHKQGIVAINGPVPISVLRSHPANMGVDEPSSPDDLAEWVNRALGLKKYKGGSPKHPGILRLSRWVVNRLADGRHKMNHPEMLGMARQWLPEYFHGVKVDPDRLQVVRKVKTIEVEVKSSELEGGELEGEALDLLEHTEPKRRIRGLSMMADIQDPDLFEWCMMFLDDESTDVRVAALRAMRDAEEGDVEIIVPHTQAEDKRIRAAAIAALAVHAGANGPYWFKRGLKDPSPCVRVEVAALLPRLDPAKHHEIFEIALYDANPDIARRARELTTGKGYSVMKW